MTGQLLGWSALLDPYRYTGSAIALEDSRLLAIPGSELLQFGAHDPRFGYLLMEELAHVVAHRLRGVHAQLALR